MPDFLIKALLLVVVVAEKMKTLKLILFNNAKTRDSRLPPVLQDQLLSVYVHMTVAITAAVKLMTNFVKKTTITNHAPED